MFDTLCMVEFTASHDSLRTTELLHSKSSPLTLPLALEQLSNSFPELHISFTTGNPRPDNISLES